MVPSSDLPAARSASSAPDTVIRPARAPDDRGVAVEVDTGCIASRRGVLPFRRRGVDDHQRAVAHLMRLPEDQRYARFAGITTADTIARRYAAADPARLRLFGCFALDEMVG